jgi:hypothetical protein
MKKLLTICLLLLPLLAGAKKRPYNWMNSDEDWNRLKMEETLSVSVNEIDTAIIVVSNRVMEKGSMRFMLEKEQRKGPHYFFVYVKGGIWHILPAPTLHSAMQYLPNKDKDMVVYTEGMGKVFPADLDRGIRLSAFYKVNVILLDYPSINSKKGSLGNYYFAIGNARDAYKSFAPVIDTIKTLRDQKQMGTGSVSLFFHSMGNNVMKGLVTHKKLKNINNEVWVDNLILNAPCVRQRRHRKWIDPINFSKNTYVHYNPEDRTLYWARLVSFSKQLGEQVKQPISGKAIYINFNTVAGENHSNFLPLPGRPANKPEIYKHYDQLFHGKTVTPGDNKGYAPTAYRKIGWDLLPQTGSASMNH